MFCQDASFPSPRASSPLRKTSTLDSNPRLEPDDIRAAMTRNQIGDMRGPALKRVALFIGKVVALINAGDAGETAAGMIEEFFDHRQLDTQPCQSGRKGASEIMNSP